MQLDQSQPLRPATRRLTVGLARDATDVRAAQRLRWKVFVEEQGARIETPEEGYDIDDLDDHCQHLIVTEAGRDGVIGTYRLLTAEAARRAGGYYAEREFEMGGLLGQRRRLLEIGRSCVLPGYRTGSTIALLWAGLAEFLIDSGHDALIGCASIPLRADRVASSQLASALCRTHPAPDVLSVAPKRALPVITGAACEPTPIPPLLKGYLRSGALVCGEPCWDPEFDCADLFLYLGLDQLASRYARRFLPNGVSDDSIVRPGSVRIPSVHVA